MVLEGLQLTALGLYISEEGGIIVRPALEGEALAEGARGDTTGDEGCLDEERPRATHGIDEVRLTLPASQKQDTSSEDFAQRSLRLCCLSQPRLCKALTRAIEVPASPRRARYGYGRGGRDCPDAPWGASPHAQ